MNISSYISTNIPSHTDAHTYTTTHIRIHTLGISSLSYKPYNDKLKATITITTTAALVVYIPIEFSSHLIVFPSTLHAMYLRPDVCCEHSYLTISGYYYIRVALVMYRR